MEKYLFALVCFLVTISILIALKPSKSNIQLPPTPNIRRPSPITPPPPKPIVADISTSMPNYLPYSNIKEQLEKWHKEAPELTELGVIGNSSRGVPIHFIRLTNQRIKTDRPEVLITGCIHGNEPLATATIMAYIGTLLDKFKDENIRKLFDERDIYFVPVLSPDSYPNSRHVDGVDPNRDYENKRSAPVRAAQDFFSKHKFKAAISGHTWGRVFLTPYGDTTEVCPDHEKYQEIVGEMAKLSGYRMMRTCELYNQGGGLNNPPIRYGETGWNIDQVMMPIYGTEIDWYYRRGCFAVVMEFGTHQRIPSPQDIKTEFDMTWTAFLHFLKEAPLAK